MILAMERWQNRCLESSLIQRLEAYMEKKIDARTEMELLYGVMATLDTPEKVRMFLSDLCTDNERENMAQRVESARLLLEGKTYQQVAAAVEISSATLSRVNRCIKHGEGGYRDLLAAYLDGTKPEGTSD